ncbi:hypothetical protein [Marinobacter alexandrii]|uniref:hypothetical protein n=1 Tax=Marinobacter alexandrii TaxID=2570351 RepID=UPI002ABE0E1B|nr:hypothetical protein [Marinobacter alexandrii]
MTRETDVQTNILDHQLTHDREQRRIDRLYDLKIHGSKGLSFLNAGAAVAVLAFIQALVDTPVYLAFKPYALVALVCFLLGAFLSAITFFFHYAHLFYFSSSRWNKALWGLLIGSSVLAFMGGVLVALGVWCAV